MGLGGFPTSNDGFILGPPHGQVGRLFCAGVRSQENPPTMDQPEKSHEKWEREFREVQHAVTPGEWLRADQIMAQKLSASPAPIRDASHLIAFLVSAVLLVFGVVIFQGDNPHKLAFGLTALIAGCCLGIAAFRWKRKS